MLFVAGAKVGYILGASILGGGFGAAAIRFREYRYERYLAWLHMDQHRQDLAYQPFQSVMRSARAGPSGLGLGRGLQTLYLPEAHTDFVAAIIGEELGFLGVAALCARVPRCSSRAACAPRCARRTTSARFLAFGLSTMFGVQALVNLAVALAILPTKGLTLPFVSFGGSSLLVNAAAAGILLSISRHAAGRAPAPSATSRRHGAARRARRASRERRRVRAPTEPRSVDVSRPTVLIAGGGTGGHVFPAVAVAEALQALADVDVVFVRDARAASRRASIPARGWRLELLDVEPMKGGGAARAVRGALVAARATLHAAGLVRALRPRAVLSVGGYAAGPVALAAASSACRWRCSSRTASSGSPTACWRPSRSAPTSRGTRRSRASAPRTVRALRRAAARRLRAAALRRARGDRCGSSCSAEARARRRSTSGCPEAIGAPRARGAGARGASTRPAAIATRPCARPTRAQGVAARHASCRSSTTWRRRIADADLVVARAGRRHDRRDRGDRARVDPRPVPPRRRRPPGPERRGARARRRRGVPAAGRGRRRAPRRRDRPPPRRRRARAAHGRRARAPAAGPTRRATSPRTCSPSPRIARARARASPTAPRSAAPRAAGGAADVPRSRPPRPLRRHRRHRHERPRRDPAHARVRRQRLGPASRTRTRAGSRALGVRVFVGHAAENVRGRRRRRLLERHRPAEPRDRPGARARDPHHPARRDARRADARALRASPSPARTARRRRPRWSPPCCARRGSIPTVVVGGKVNALGSNARLGEGDLFVAEADESDGSFLKLTPTIAVVTNIDAEHLDHYGTHDAVKDAFVAARQPRAVLRPLRALHRPPAACRRSCRASSGAT